MGMKIMIMLIRNMNMTTILILRLECSEVQDGSR